MIPYPAPQVKSKVNVPCQEKKEHALTTRKDDKILYLSSDL